MRTAVFLIPLMLGTPLDTAGQQAAPEQPSVTLPPELARVLTDYETAWRARKYGFTPRSVYTVLPGFAVVRYVEHNGEVFAFGQAP